jgi:prepilin-type N-terminal cleavage/methylation domain-containing protein
MTSYAESEHGFTYLELLVVVFLIGIIGSLVAVRVGSGLERTRFEAAVKECTALLILAKTHAVRLHEPVSVAFSADSKELIAKSLRIDAKGELKEVKVKTLRLPEAVGTCRISSSGVKPVSVEDEVVFSYMGTSKGGEVILRPQRGTGKRISITPLTGAVRVENTE